MNRRGFLLGILAVGTAGLVPMNVIAQEGRRGQPTRAVPAKDAVLAAAATADAAVKAVDDAVTAVDDVAKAAGVARGKVDAVPAKAGAAPRGWTWPARRRPASWRTALPVDASPKP